MPVMLADSEDMEAVELLIGGTVARFTTSNPPVTLVVPEFCRLVTTAAPRFGSTAIADGGPLSATVVAPGAPCTCPMMPVLVVGSDFSKTVRSMADKVFEPPLATS